MTLIAVVEVGKDHHHVPAKELLRHTVTDSLYCACCPTAVLHEDHPDLPITVTHVSLAWRKWGHRTFEPE